LKHISIMDPVANGFLSVEHDLAALANCHRRFSKPKQNHAYLMQKKELCDKLQLWLRTLALTLA